MKRRSGGVLETPVVIFNGRTWPCQICGTKVHHFERWVRRWSRVMDTEHRFLCSKCEASEVKELMSAYKSWIRSVRQFAKRRGLSMEEVLGMIAKRNSFVGEGAMSEND